MKKISIDDAMKRAFWHIKVPSLSVLVIPLLSYAFLDKYGYIPLRGLEAWKYAGPVFAFAFIGSWLIWSVQVPKWRLWAYQRVDNIKTLKEVAAMEQIIWREGHFFEKTEIASKEVWEEIKRIEARKS